MGLYIKEYQGALWPLLLTETLFAIVKMRQESMRPLTNGKENGILFSLKKRRKLPFVTACINLEDINE